MADSSMFFSGLHYNNVLGPSAVQFQQPAIDVPAGDLSFSSLPGRAASADSKIASAGDNPNGTTKAGGGVVARALPTAVAERIVAELIILWANRQA